MAKPTQPVAVNNLKPQQKVRIEMIRRGWKTADLAERIGYKTDSLTNLLGGNMQSQAAQNRIEEVLGLPIWSTPEEFIARLDTPEKIQAYKRSIYERAGGQIAGLENFGLELQQLTAKLGLHIVVIQFDSSPQSPVWQLPNTAAPFSEEISAARAGEFDSTRMNEAGYFAFYHCHALGKALEVLTRGIKEHGLRDHARLFFIEAETGGWRMVHPPTAELILPSPWNT